MELVSKWVAVRVDAPLLSITVTHNGTTFTGDRMAVCEHLDIGMGKLERLRKNPPNGMFFDVTRRAGVDRQARKSMQRELKSLKKVPHADIPDELPIAYIAGFIDADGCLSLKRDQLKIGVSQKHPAIVCNFQRRFGGWMGPSKGTAWQWASMGDEGERIMRLIHPHLQTVKKRRAELMLGRTYLNRAQTDRDLLMIKNQRRFL